ncbi:hypothetical protein K469DRAFT_685453 [Zopfia rhizophila CBS 207.26]|uniref:Uncharacterized protein n=1 Tax=Zopfia rhizophila CBS 207.26 TaxID=1314779 RepID=A0A6A6EAH7_9PEZI|nr:hypothetical protein K469DRAFT_685453 [Zopfia rhizophila CBS 207.26]
MSSQLQPDKAYRSLQCLFSPLHHGRQPFATLLTPSLVLPTPAPAQVSLYTGGDLFPFHNAASDAEPDFWSMIAAGGDIGFGAGASADFGAGLQQQQQQQPQQAPPQQDKLVLGITAWGGTLVRRSTAFRDANVEEAEAESYA